MKDAGMPYLDILDDRISRDDFSALYNEYLPKNAPADGNEQDRLIKLFIKALEQKIKGKQSDQGDTQETKDAEAATQETTATEPKNAKLNKARQNNLKIIKAFKEVGLPADDLTVTAKNKNGKDYRKASDKLNKLRKTLFGEALDEDENPFNQEF
jgi:predicted HNH restriction endonuclease